MLTGDGDAAAVTATAGDTVAGEADDVMGAAGEGDRVVDGEADDVTGAAEQEPSTQPREALLHTVPEAQLSRYVMPLEHCANLVQSQGSA